LELYFETLIRLHVVLLNRAGPRHVGALDRLIIWRPVKPIFFKYMSKIYLVMAGRNWFSALYKMAPRAAAGWLSP
jgi:hypothetical protein